MAFPPYKRDQIDRNTCSSQPYAHNDMPPGESGIPPNNINEIVLSAIDIEMEMEVNIMYPVVAKSSFAFVYLFLFGPSLMSVFF